jgi:hypothetical protein
MTKIDINQLPQELMKIGEHAIAHALTGSALPEKFNVLEVWFESDGWDYLVGHGCTESYGLNLKDLSYWRFNDQELTLGMEIQDFGQITNDLRVSFAHSLIEEAASELDNTICPSIHYIEIECNKKSAVIGCLLEIHGQSGPVACWQGIYRDREEFIKAIRKNGIIMLDQLHLIKDEEILSFWERG